MLGIYVIVATKLFKNDKLAYVYDSQIQLTRSYAGQIKGEVLFLKSIADSLVGEFDLEQKSFTQKGKEIFEQSSFLKGYVLLSSNNKEDSKFTSSILKKTDLEIQENVHLSSKKIQQFEQQIQFTNITFDYFDKDKSLFYVCIKHSGQWWSISIYESLDLMPIFLNLKSSGQYLVDSNGKVLLGHMDDSLKSIEQTNFFKEIKKSHIPEGTVDSQWNASEVLVSFVRIGLKDLMIISIINKSMAFGALNELMRKSILFFIALISASIIISILASKHFTLRLTLINTGVQELTQGNFQYKIDENKMNSSYFKDELTSLSFGFNHMGEKITQLLAQLKEYSDNLEKMVQERTAQLHEINTLMSAMMNNLGQGIFVFDKNGIVAPFYTKICETFFQSNINGKNIKDLLASSNEETIFEKWMTTLFAQLIPFEDMALLGPKIISQNSEHYVELSYRPIYDLIDNVETLVSCMVVATDKTIQRKIERKAFENQEYANRILKIAKNKDGFITFQKEFQNILAQLEEILKKDQSSLLDKNSVLIHLHSLKGAAGMFSLTELRERLHEHETKFSQIDKIHEQFDYLHSLILDIQEQSKKIVQDFKEIVGPSIVDGKERVEILRDDLIHFLKLLEKENISSFLHQNFKENFVYVPIEKYLRPFSDVVVEHAKKTNKLLVPIIFKNGDLKINPDVLKNLFPVLIHPFLNAVDHGLEIPEKRESEGKQKFGRIVVQASKEVIKSKVYLKITIQDDGKGIDPDRIRLKLESLGVKAEEISRDDHQVIQHIFDPSFSTAETLTISSGRGVGMDALKSAVKNLGGVVDVISTLGVGTTIRIFAPLSQSYSFLKE